MSRATLYTGTYYNLFCIKSTCYVMQDVAAMEINANTVSKDFQAPNFEHPPGINGFVQTPLSLQAPTIANTGTTVDSPSQQQQQVGNTQRGQQRKKASRFLLEMPQLSMPRPRPVTSTIPANPRPQVLITRPNMEQQQQQQYTASPQATAKTNQRRVAQLQMPSLRTPSRPKLPTTSTVVHHAATTVTGSNQSQNTSLNVSKPSLQISMPAQVEPSRTMVHQALKKNAIHVQSQPGPANAAPHTQQQHVGSLSPETVGNGVVASEHDANTTATNTSQEMQMNNASMPQDTPNLTSVNKEDESLSSDEITEANRGEEGASVFSATDVQIQQPLQLTTPTQQAPTASASGVNTNTTSSMTADNTVEMADPPITTYADLTFTSFNQAAQEMDTTSTTSSQDPIATATANTSGYPMYGAEVYQQPNQQMQMV
jgi:hypothetical protein